MQVKPLSRFPFVCPLNILFNGIADGSIECLSMLFMLLVFTPIKCALSWPLKRWVEVL